jgi:GTP-binding protein
MASVIAIVGRPNVGKSALFNRLVGQRIAIVHDEPGVTRDRISATAEWRGRAFTLLDTGGIGLWEGQKVHDVILKATMDQVQLAIDAADLIMLVVDVREGLMPLDREVADRLRRIGKPTLVVANKADTPAAAAAAVEFTELGLGEVFPVSALHGKGIEALMKAALARLPQHEADAPAASELAEPPTPPIKLAIVGRPNVGKSSLINALTRSERVIVTPIPGTTRDAVDVPFELETDGIRQPFVLIDTAGLRKARQIRDSIEFYSVKRAEAAIGRCDIAILVLDAESGPTEQDKKIGGLILEKQRACVVVVNKWDLVEEAIQAARAQAKPHHPRPSSPSGPRPMTSLRQFQAWVQERLFFLDYAPVIFASALTGFNLDRLWEAVRYVAAQWHQKVPTALLNRTLQDAVNRQPPRSRAGHALKLFYATQIQQAPPTFLLFVNRDEPLSEPYRKYLIRELRRAFGYEGCPIVLLAKPRPKTIEPIRSKSSEHRP